MNADKGTVKSRVTALVARIQNLKTHGQEIDHLLGDLVLRLNNDFPGDVGIFVAYFLNHVNLKVKKFDIFKKNFQFLFEYFAKKTFLAGRSNVFKS